MKTQRIPQSKHGFTLMELMVAMAITTIIVTVLVSITSIAMDTWNRSRAELRAARQAKSMVDTMARDFEALITRRGNDFEWLSAESPDTLAGENLKSTNASNLIFFSGSTERYNGDIGGKDDNGGDVSCIGYSLIYADPFKEKGKDFPTFILKRKLVNPDDTFNDLLGKGEKNKEGLLKTAFDSKYSSELDKIENFVCENVFQFTVTFMVEVTQVTGTTTKTLTVPVTIGQSASGQVTKSLTIKGTGLFTTATPSSVSSEELKAGRVKAMEINLTVLSDPGVDQVRKGAFNKSKVEEFMMKNSFQYTKLIQLPSM
jgi:prepilin-type N-terminal cleavage/methylation domain-containing protein